MKAETRQPPNSNEDFELIEKILAGDVNLFEKIQKKYHRQLFSLVLRMIRNYEDAQDIVQETFIRAFNNLDKYQKEFQFHSWLFKIASNLCIDCLRRRRFQHISIDMPAPYRDDADALDFVDEEANADKDLLSKEQTNILNKAIEELPEHYRKVIILRHFEELDYKEIAEQLAIPIGTVKAHLFRARRILMELLKRKNFPYLTF